MSDTLLAQGARNILRAASEAETGIIVTIASPIPVIAMALRAKQVLYRFKAEDAAYSNIQIILSPDSPDTELWLINNRTQT